MLTFEKFTGINNVLSTEALKLSELSEATNVDIDLDGRIRLRAGYSEESAVCHKNVHQADGFLLATNNGGDLVNVDTEAVLYASLGVARVWYCNLPDGRTAFSNGLIAGLVTAAACTALGVPIPEDVGTFDDTAGDLAAGAYRYQLTHVRTSDGREGGPIYSDVITVADGGIALTGLPELAGHTLNVYLTPQNGDRAYLVGSTADDTFTYTGDGLDLTIQCRTDKMQPPPVGAVMAFWRGRLLIAVDNVLYATKPHMIELCDVMRDFKQFKDDITLVQPVEGGIWVGTTGELSFLRGNTFDGLVREERAAEGVVLGSGVTVPGDQIAVGKGVGSDTAMICICGGTLRAGLTDGSLLNITDGRYETDATEVAATFRVRDGIPQYIAIEQ